MTAITGFMPDCSALTASFKYDPLGRRIEKTINGRTIKYLYDGLDIVQEMENNAVTVNYLRTMNIDEPLARLEANGTVRYYQTDALGSIIALTDTNGAVRTTYAYDPFGNTTVGVEASDNPFQYTGRENDGTGPYYYRARYYNQELQRFISEDPIGFDGGSINLYEYVKNRPTKLRDPLGLSPIRWIPWKWFWKQLGKQLGKNIGKPDTEVPEEGDDDGDGVPNFGDPDSEFCKVNCDQIPPQKCH
ncbi:MAG: hypothetical protein HZA17_13900 [Nitrospirae bacterium]|nr:hypothetical protein [Nitrospirota bacterium]